MWWLPALKVRPWVDPCERGHINVIEMHDAGGLESVATWRCARCGVHVSFDLPEEWMRDAVKRSLDAA